MTQTSERAAVQVRLTGLVQGVGFRQFVRDRALRSRIAGWVRNREDGSSVVLYAEGPRDQLEPLLVDVENGPPGSRVDEIEVEWITPLGQLESFEIRR